MNMLPESTNLVQEELGPEEQASPTPTATSYTNINSLPLVCNTSSSPVNTQHMMYGSICNPEGRDLGKFCSLFLVQVYLGPHKDTLDL